ncbi:MAG: glutamine synthetase family protein, partial [Lachnospiraceae bacterium]|nr:glutamine synthetase family protein [Lachnospiraceae bacterium]
QEVKQFVEEEDVKFIRLAFCDIFGKAKNISIMPTELDRAFREGIAVDAWAVAGFERFDRSDIFLHPDPGTLAVLPWRPEHGKVVRMFCDITWPDGTPFPCDTRGFLRKAVQDAAVKGYTFSFGTEQEFYLFRNDLEGEATNIPYDNASYMDVGPEDRGENIRREICITLEQMGIFPESSHHEEGPGQNEIDFRYCEALKSADDAMTFRTVVSAVANRNGVWADFSPKPIKEQPGNGMHVNFSVRHGQKEMDLSHVVAGVLDKIREMTLFMNPEVGSFERLGSLMAPGYITWARENRSTLIRIPAAFGEYERGELRSPDTKANPYLVFGLMIYAGLQGIDDRMVPPPTTDINLYRVDKNTLKSMDRLPSSLADAADEAARSQFIEKYMPAEILAGYLDRVRK